MVLIYIEALLKYMSTHGEVKGYASLLKELEKISERYKND
jgi:hypothetical protein